MKSRTLDIYAPKGVVSNLTFVEAVEILNNNKDFILIESVLENHAHKRNGQTFFTGIENLKFICEDDEVLSSLRFSHRANANFLEEETRQLLLSSFNICQKNREYIVGPKYKVLSFIIRKWRVQEDVRENFYLCSVKNILKNPKEIFDLTEYEIKNIDEYLCKELTNPDTNPTMSKWRVILKRELPELSEQIYKSYEK